MPKSFKDLKKTTDFCILAVSLPMAIRGLRPQDGSKRAQDGPKRAEKAPHDGFRGLHEEPPEGPKKQKTMDFLRFFIGFWILTFLGFRQLKTAQEASRIAPRGPNRAPI